MEEYDFILRAIGTVGFPILCCVYMATVGRKTIEKLATSNDNLARAIETFGEAAGRHSALLERIESKIDRVEDKLEHHAEMFVEFKAKVEQSK